MNSKYPKILILALDGFDPVLFSRLRHQLPNLSKWADQGVFTEISSTVPPMTFPAWSTFLTGANPGKHGIFDFTERVPGELKCRFLNATRRRLPSFLKLASDHGVKVGSIGIPCTFPPEQLSAFQISGFDTPLPSKADSRYITPRTLAAEIETKLGGIYFGNFNESRITDNWHRKVLDKMIDNIDRKTVLAKYLIEKFPLDLLVVHVGETDTVGHHYWCYADSQSPRFVPTDDSAVSYAIRTIYQKTDELCGDIENSFQPDCIMVVSDHGMGGTSDRALYLNRYLESCGLLKFRRKSISWQWTSLGKRMGMKWIPYRLQQHIFRLAGGKIASDIESGQRFGSIDWENTNAYSEELNYNPAIWLNIKGRDHFGTVEPDRVIETTERVAGKLLAWKDPVDGTSIVKQVRSRDEIYQGDQISYAPDLIVELNRPEGFTYALGRSTSEMGDSPFRLLNPEEYVGYKGASMNGSHTSHGTFIIKDVNCIRDKLACISLQDIAPTVLNLFGITVPNWMDGHSLIVPGHLDEVDTIKINLASNSSSEDEALLYSRLLELGYLG